MASPEAASVVERLRRWSDDPAVTSSHTEPLKADVRALLAVVEAAKDATTPSNAWRLEDLILNLQAALDALYSPDSAESKDAEGAKP